MTLPAAYCLLPAIGEEFLYCVKAAGFADGSPASGRACGLRPVPPYAVPQQRQGAADPDRSLSVVLRAAGDEGWGGRRSQLPHGPQALGSSRAQV